MGKDLKAENLTISVPNFGCDKNCPYCVSRMTGYIDHDINLMKRNINKVKTIAKAAEITSILITGKGEPMYNDDSRMFTYNLIREFKDWPVELQTNGIYLSKYHNKVANLQNAGLDVLAVSIDRPFQLVALKPLFHWANEYSLVTRITINVTNLLQDTSFNILVKYCKDNKINQLTLRQIVKPIIVNDKKTGDWIDTNAPKELYDELLEQFRTYDKRLIRTLNNGVKIYDVDGIAFSHSEYCIQEQDNGDNIRSLIFLEDGHLYTSWGSKASILF